MKTQRTITPILVALFLIGCASIQPGNDPVVVNAERSTNVAFETINTFLQIEYTNQAWVKANAPQIHTYANYLRGHAKQWVASATDLIGAYKHNRTPENKASLQTAVAVLTTAEVQAQKYTAQIGQH